MSRRRTRPMLAMLALTAALPAIACAAGDAKTPPAKPASENPAKNESKGDKVVKSEDEWKKILSPEQFRILREKGTERAFTGKYWNEHREGRYLCAACGAELFASDTKFESGSGWPSFYQPMDPARIAEETDRAYGMVRTEVMCSRCGGHLGHVFDDGPKPTGLRYCINSASLEFKPADEGAEKK